MKKPNIILIGMPACGKSTVGVILAKTLNKAFVDTDITMQQQEGMTLQEIINTRGLEAFAQVEERVLCDFAETNCVVAPGGSAVYYPAAMEHLKQQGTVIYLQVSLDTVLSRLSNIKTRGVTLKKGQTLADLYAYRVPLYESYADITICGDFRTVEEVVEEIVKRYS